MASIKYEHALRTQNWYFLGFTSSPAALAHPWAVGRCPCRQREGAKGFACWRMRSRTLLEVRMWGRVGRESKSKKPRTCRTCIMVSINLQDKFSPFLPGIFLEKSGVLENVLPIPELEVVSSLMGQSHSLFVALSL